jgi:hypothetical protein
LALAPYANLVNEAGSAFACLWHRIAHNLYEGLRGHSFNKIQTILNLQYITISKFNEFHKKLVRYSMMLLIVSKKTLLSHPHVHADVNFKGRGGGGGGGIQWVF